ncbi:catalysis At the Interface: the anatomy of A conformational change in A triglyceride lipase, partial [Phascolomyces articulosus]
LGGNVREASQSEIDDHIFYTKLSAASYCRRVIPLNIWNCKHCDKSLKLIKTFSTLVDDTNAMILRGDQQKKIYVVFRGTNSVRSFVVDAKFSLADYPLAKGAKVHKGFLASYNAIRDKVIQTLDAQVEQYPDYQVAITGHSLGGAQAVLHALDLLNVNGTRYNADNMLLYTQGQPRVGNLKFAQYELDSKIPVKRLTSKRDLIPHLPPLPMLYINAGEEYWIPSDDNTKVKVCPNGLESPHCANSISPFTSLMDHLSYFGINLGLC